MNPRTLALARRARIAPATSHARAAWICSERRVTRRRTLHSSPISSNQSQSSVARMHRCHQTKAHGAQRSTLSTMAEYRTDEYSDRGPLEEYDARVKAGKLSNDEHQRNLVGALQDLHVMLASYQPPQVKEPSIEAMKPKKGLFASLFSRTDESLFGSGGNEANQIKLVIPDSLPKGLYMYGDVGSGKTMLMDLFYDTLPPNIKKKTRIHFHNFMQDVHKSVHKMKMQHGSDMDVIPFVAAQIASDATVLCFDEFQCTDVGDAMILRRLVESLMAHGTVLVTTSNRHPKELYKNGLQRESFIPCINLLLHRLRVLNLDSSTDYRKIPRPPGGVYHHPIDQAAKSHADHWFRFFGDFKSDPPHPATETVWGRPINVPQASGDCARFTFKELIGAATGAADYIELTRRYGAFVVTDVPGMSARSRDHARRFITFIDAVYERRAKLALTCARPLAELFVTADELREASEEVKKSGAKDKGSSVGEAEELHGDVGDSMRMMMDDLGLDMKALKASSLFSGDEEAFAFSRALSRLSEMGSKEWVERGMEMSDAHNWAEVREEYKKESG